MIGRNFLVWCVDSSTKTKWPKLILESKEELRNLITSYKLQNIPLLVLVTKGKLNIFLFTSIISLQIKSHLNSLADVPGGYSAYEVGNILELEKLGLRKCTVISVSVNGEGVGIEPMKQWLVLNVDPNVSIKL